MASASNLKRNLAALTLAGGTLLALLTQDEGTVYTPYVDIAGVLTVCQGHTGPDIIPGKVYTKSECDALLVKDATVHGLGILACTDVPINQNQYDAYTRFAVNVGVANFCASSLLKKLNAGDYTGGCDGMLAWDKIKVKDKKTGKVTFRVVKRQTRRRQAERRHCLTPVSTTPTKGVPHVWQTA